jgi:outer membrane protein TolC
MKALWLTLLVAAAPASAQDTLRLPALQDAAVQQDPRARQLLLQEAATELRLRNIAAERLPSLTFLGEASHQSEVPGIPIELPGMEIPQPPKSRYEAAVNVEQLLYDGGVLSRRRAAEEAHLRAERARIAAALHPLRSEVNQAFFRALLLQARTEETALLIADLEARLDMLRTQVREGSALPGDTAVVRAEMLRAAQNHSEAAADRRAALAVLAQLTDVQITEGDVLQLPDLAEAVRRIQAVVAPYDTAARMHPRYSVFDAEREQLEQQSSLVQARAQPQISAFGQLAYGRPGPKQFTDEFHEYWLAGVRLRWQPWNWGTTAREREVLRIQQDVVHAEEASFTEQLRREVQDDVQTIERLQSAVALDEQIIALREQVERQARAQLAERVMTPADYVDVRTDLQEARLALQRHRVELAQARAHYLTTLGVGPR